MISHCPKGSEIGSGTVKAQALGLGITAHGRVAMFNSHHGASITFNVQTNHPAYIKPVVRRPDHAAARRQVPIDGAVRVRGVQHDYVAARTCPPRAMHGVFDFTDSATGQSASATTDAKLRCTVS